MGLFGSSVKQSSAKATSTSGIGDFTPTNNISISSGLIDLTDPVQLVAMAGLLLVGFISYRRF